MPGLPCDHAKNNTSRFVRESGPISGVRQQMLLHHHASVSGLGGRTSDDVSRSRGKDVNRPYERQGFIADDIGWASAAKFHGYGSDEGEQDLAAMVYDFMENGSCGSDLLESSDGENGAMTGPKLFEIIQGLKFNSTPLEKEVFSMTTVLALSIKESELICMQTESECKGECIRQLLVKGLRCCGIDAAVCTSKWLNSGRVPGGEYEYIDAIFKDDSVGAIDRLIVDIDFQSQFEIARPTLSYAAALKFLPGVFVGCESKLRQILQVMAEAAKHSLRQNSMPLPPWRTLDYMTAKWMSPSERKVVDTHSGTLSREMTWAKKCIEQLRHLKVCIHAETDQTRLGKPLAVGERNVALKSWRDLYLEKNLNVIATTAEKNPD